MRQRILRGAGNQAIAVIPLFFDLDRGAGQDTLRSLDLDLLGLLHGFLGLGELDGENALAELRVGFVAIGAFRKTDGPLERAVTPFREIVAAFLLAFFSLIP